MRRRIKEDVPLNSRNVEYPLPGDLMAFIRHRAKHYAFVEVEISGHCIDMDNDTLLNVFVHPEDRDMCRRAYDLFGVAQPDKHGFIYDGVRCSIRHNDPSILLPRYISDGPVYATPEMNYAEKFRKFFEFQNDTYTRWVEVVAMISTLNDTCTSIGDVLANFPALEQFGKDNTMLQAVIQSRKPVMRPTKMSAELRSAYKRASTTVARMNLLEWDFSNVATPRGMWRVSCNYTPDYPDWFLHSPGCRNF